jgi:hypothetical protein
VVIKSGYLNCAGKFDLKVKQSKNAKTERKNVMVIKTVI